MSGKWRILETDGTPIGKSTEFPPSKIAKDERVSYIGVVFLREVMLIFSETPIQEVVKDFGRATATLHQKNLSSFEWRIKVVADTPEQGQVLLDKIHDKICVR